MASKYLNVKEFAKMAGVSYQSIYKRLSNPNDSIQKYVSMVNRHLAISMDAIDSISFRSKNGIYFKPAAETPHIPSDAQEAAAERYHTNNVLSSMMDVMNVLKGQLEEKDRQIEALQQNISECLKIMRHEHKNEYEHEL